MENKVNQNVAGLNLDAVNWQIKDGLVTYALNANIQGHDGESFTYTNEPSNQSCYDFSVNKPGFKIVGRLPIIEQNKLVVWLAHPDGRSEIGVVSKLDQDCQSINIVSEKDCDCPNGKEIVTEVLTIYPAGNDLDSCCQYTPVVTDNCDKCNQAPFDKKNCCLNLSIEYPVEAVYRLDECETQIGRAHV